MAKRKAPRAGTRATKARSAASAKSRRRPSGAKRPARQRERRTQVPETLRLREIQPNFTVNDLDRSRRFYTNVLGFFEGEKWSEGGVVKMIMLKAGACELGLSQDDWAKGRDRQKGQGMRVYCRTVQDIDALAARIKKFGGMLTEEPKDQPWGVRSLSVDDPDGFHLTFYREHDERE